MNTPSKKDLVTEYIEGWKANDKARILAGLADHCIVIESHGPRFDGKEKIGQWIDEWIAQGSQVTKWDLSSQIEEGNTVAAEWFFACTHRGTHYEFCGASIFVFSNGLVSQVREYKMTENQTPPNPRSRASSLNVKRRKI